MPSGVDLSYEQEDSKSKLNLSWSFWVQEVQESRSSEGESGEKEDLHSFGGGAD